MPGAAPAQQQESLLPQHIGDPPTSGGKTAMMMAPTMEDFIWAPYTNRGDFMWGPYLRSLFQEYFGSFMLCWIVSTTVSISTSSSAALNAFGIAATYGGSTAFFYSWRQTMRLPRHLNPAITFAEFLHRHVGLIVALPYMGLQLAGSATAFVPLHGLGSSAIPNYATALRPVSYWVAVAVDLSLGTFVVYAYMQNASVADKLAGIPRHAEMSSKNRGFSSQAIVTGLAIFLSVFISYANGLYALANYVPYFGAAIDIGFTVPTSNAWTLPCVWFLVAGTVGYLLHFVTWNMNGLGNADFQAFVATTATEEEMLDAKASQWIACRIKSE